MKRKTSISLSEDVLRKLDRYVDSAASRSAYIERVLRRHFRERTRARVNARDRRRLDAAAERLNREAEEVLEDQATWLTDEDRDPAS
jgi:metal-responsive CopG/Arc/MetJ family transcriptional regulator